MIAHDVNRTTEQLLQIFFHIHEDEWIGRLRIDTDINVACRFVLIAGDRAEKAEGFYSEVSSKCLAAGLQDGDIISFAHFENRFLQRYILIHFRQKILTAKWPERVNRLAFPHFFAFNNILCDYFITFASLLTAYKFVIL